MSPMISQQLRIVGLPIAERAAELNL